MTRTSDGLDFVFFCFFLGGPLDVEDVDGVRRDARLAESACDMME